MWRTIRMTACTLSAALALSGLALAQYDYGRGSDRDNDDYRRDSGQADQYGYQNGYNDGVGKGRHEGREHDPNDYQTPDWRKASHGYQRWMGSQGAYQHAYREGYSNGFRAGYEETAGGRYDRSRGNGWQHDGWRVGYEGDSGNVANRFGYEDGSEAAREDLEHRKSYNSSPRGRFGGRDDGYRREFGSKDRYRAEYTAGYRAGYDSVMRRRY
jgi:hypothetical protein